jgi:hypothetical protein
MPAAILAPMPDTRVLAVVVVAVLLPACLDPQQTAPGVGRSAHEVNAPMRFEPTSAENVQITGTSNNGLVKTSGGTAWNAGAVSKRSFGGHGWVRFSTGESTTGKVLGLSKVSDGNDDETRADIDYGIWLNASGAYSVWENESVATNPQWSYIADDLFYIEVTPTSILYRKGLPTSNPFWTTVITNDEDFFPLQVDTSIRDENATITDVVINADPLVHVAAQDHFLDDEFDLRCGVNDVLSISGSHFLQIEDDTPETEDFTAFGDETVEDIAGRLTQYKNQQSIPAGFEGTIIMDIENPHPMDLHLRSAGEQASIIEGYKRRIVATRRVFQDPDLKIGLYGTLVPDGQGQNPQPPDPPNAYQLAHDALVEAGEEGLFNAVITADGETEAGVDWLMPVLYIRFGCDGEPPEADCDGPFDTIEAYTILGITGSGDIRRSDGSSIPLLPLLGVRVHNKVGHTLFHHVPLRDLGVSTETDPFPGTLRLQMETLDAYGIDDAVLWTGGNTNGVITDAEDNPTTWDINDYTCWM